MAHGHTIKVLVTGFGPFPRVHDNPSAELVRRIRHGQLRLPPDFMLHTAIVPTSWTAVKRFAENDLAALDPDIALHFGVSSRARGFRIEQVARNAAGTAADCDGKILRRPCLVTGTPATLPATIDTEKIVQALRGRGLDASTSRDAGRYLCNMLFYLSLDQASDRTHGRQTGFIHVPRLRTDTRNAPAHDITGLLTGAQIILNHCAGVQRRLNRAIRQAA